MGIKRRECSENVFWKIKKHGFVDVSQWDQYTSGLSAQGKSAGAIGYQDKVSLGFVSNVYLSLSVFGKTRNIAFLTNFAAMLLNKLIFFVACFTIPYLKISLGTKRLPCFDSALYLTIWLGKTKATRGWRVFKIYKYGLLFLVSHPQRWVVVHQFKL